MQNLYIMRFYALQFVPRKVSVDAISLLYSELLFAKLSLVEFRPILLNCIGNLLSNVAAFFGC